MAEFSTAPDEIRRLITAAGWEIRALEEPEIVVEGAPGPRVVVATVVRGERLGRVTVAAVSDAPHWLAVTYGGMHPATRTFDNASVWVSAFDGAAARRQIEALDAALGDDVSSNAAMAFLERDGWSVDRSRSGDSYDGPGWDVFASRPGEHLLAYVYWGIGAPFEGTALEAGKARRQRGRTVLSVEIRSVTIAERLLGDLVAAL